MHRFAPWLAALLLASCASDSATSGAGGKLFRLFHEPLPTVAAQGGGAGVGDVIVLTPVPCSAVSRSDLGPDNSCPEPLLRSGSGGGREFVAAFGFDLADLPPSSEVLYAGLELTGLDVAFLERVGQWDVRMIDVPDPDSLPDLSFGRLLAAPESTPGASWRLRATELSPGGRNTLEFDQGAKDALALRIGHGSVTFRIEGPAAEDSLFGWAASGEDGPRLRVGYVAMPDARGEAVRPSATRTGPWNNRLCPLTSSAI